MEFDKLALAIVYSKNGDALTFGNRSAKEVLKQHIIDESDKIQIDGLEISFDEIAKIEYYPAIQQLQ